MKCSRVRDKLMDYTSADLLPGELQQINEHLMGCEECRAALDLARSASSALNMLGSEEPAPSLVGAVRARIGQDSRTRRPAPIPRLAMGFSAATLVALVVAGWLHYGSVKPDRVAVKPADGGQTHVTAPAKPTPTERPSAPVAEPNREPIRTAAMNHTEKPAAPSVKPQRPAADAVKQIRQIPTPKPSAAKSVSPAAEPDADSEPVMLIAVQPKEPEIYVMHLDSDEDGPSTELTVVREFDGGGNITSVSIDGEPSTDDSGENDTPSLDRTQLLDAPPTGELRAGDRHAGGSAANA